VGIKKEEKGNSGVVFRTTRDRRTEARCKRSDHTLEDGGERVRGQHPRGQTKEEQKDRIAMSSSERAKSIFGD